MTAVKLDLSVTCGLYLYVLLNHTVCGIVFGDSGRSMVHMRPHDAKWTKLITTSNNVSLNRLFENIFLQEMFACKWNHLALFVDHDFFMSPVHNILDRIRLSHIYFLQFEISDSTESTGLDTLVWDLYHQQGVVNFVHLSSQSPGRVIEALHRDFEKEQFRYAATLPHDVHLLLVSSVDQGEDLHQELSLSVFDNVAVIFLQKDYSFSMKTLMWRQNRRREFEMINYSVGINSGKKASSQICKLFPNNALGMNGRHLRGLAKEWKAFLYTIGDPSTAQMKYVGFMVELLDYMSAYLNFTYELVPKPGEDGNFTWDTFSTAMTEFRADFGATIWLANTELYLDNNMSVSHPVMFGSFYGLYMPATSVQINLLPGRFKWNIVISLGGCLMLALPVYLYILSDKNVLIARGTPELPLDKKKLCKQILCSVCSGATLDSLFMFIGALHNQGNVMIPKKLSARILISFWWTMALMLNMILVGNFTSTLISNDRPLLLRTYEQLASQEYYRWGLEQFSTMNEILKTSKEGSLNRKLYDGMKRFEVEDPSVTVSSTDQLIERLLTGRFVIFLLDYRFNELSKIVPSLVKMPYPLLMTNLGMIAPKNSTLLHLLSKAILKLSDAGILDVLKLKYFPKEERAVTEDCPGKADCPVTLESLYGCLIVCSCSICAACVFLVLECLVARIINRSRLYNDNHTQISTYPVKSDPIVCKS